MNKYLKKYKNQIGGVREEEMLVKTAIIQNSYIVDAGIFADDPIISPVFSPDSSYFVKKGTRGLVFFRMDGILLATYDPGPHKISCFTFSHDGKHLIYCRVSAIVILDVTNLNYINIKKEIENPFDAIDPYDDQDDIIISIIQNPTNMGNLLVNNNGYIYELSDAFDSDFRIKRLRYITKRIPKGKFVTSPGLDYLVVWNATNLVIYGLNREHYFGEIIASQLDHVSSFSDVKFTPNRTRQDPSLLFLLFDKLYIHNIQTDTSVKTVKQFYANESTISDDGNLMALWAMSRKDITGDDNYVLKISRTLGTNNKMVPIISDYIISLNKMHEFQPNRFQFTHQVKSIVFSPDNQKIILVSNNILTGNNDTAILDVSFDSVDPYDFLSIIETSTIHFLEDVKEKPPEDVAPLNINITFENISGNLSDQEVDIYHKVYVNNVFVTRFSIRIINTHTSESFKRYIAKHIQSNIDNPYSDYNDFIQSLEKEAKIVYLHGYYNKWNDDALAKFKADFPNVKKDNEAPVNNPTKEDISQWEKNTAWNDSGLTYEQLKGVANKALMYSLKRIRERLNRTKILLFLEVILKTFGRINTYSNYWLDPEMRYQNITNYYKLKLGINNELPVNTLYNDFITYEEYELQTKLLWGYINEDREFDSIAKDKLREKNIKLSTIESGLGIEKEFIIYHKIEDDVIYRYNVCNAIDCYDPHFEVVLQPGTPEYIQNEHLIPMLDDTKTWYELNNHHESMVEVTTLNYLNNNVTESIKEFQNNKIFIVKKLNDYLSNEYGKDYGLKGYDGEFYTKIASVDTSLNIVKNREITNIDNENPEYLGSYHFNITLPHERFIYSKPRPQEHIDDHMAFAQFLQLLEPLLISNYSFPDINSYMDRDTKSESSFRLFLNHYSFAGTAPLEDDISTSRSTSHNEELYRRMSIFDYPGLQHNIKGADFRRELTGKGKFFGFEFRIMDCFPERYLKEFLDLLYLLAFFVFTKYNTNVNVLDENINYKMLKEQGILYNEIQNVLLNGSAVYLDKRYTDTIISLVINLDVKNTMENPVWEHFVASGAYLGDNKLSPYTFLSLLKRIFYNYYVDLTDTPLKKDNLIREYGPVISGYFNLLKDVTDILEMPYTALMMDKIVETQLKIQYEHKFPMIKEYFLSLDKKSLEKKFKGQYDIEDLNNYIEREKHRLLLKETPYNFRIPYIFIKDITSYNYNSKINILNNYRLLLPDKTTITFNKHGENETRGHKFFELKKKLYNIFTNLYNNNLNQNQEYIYNYQKLIIEEIEKMLEGHRRKYKISINKIFFIYKGGTVMKILFEAYNKYFETEFNRQFDHTVFSRSDSDYQIIIASDLPDFNYHYYIINVKLYLIIKKIKADIELNLSKYFQIEYIHKGVLQDVLIKANEVLEINKTDETYGDQFKKIKKFVGVQANGHLYYKTESNDNDQPALENYIRPEGSENVYTDKIQVNDKLGHEIFGKDKSSQTVISELQNSLLNIDRKSFFITNDKKDHLLGYINDIKPNQIYMYLNETNRFYDNDVLYNFMLHRVKINNVLIFESADVPSEYGYFNSPAELIDVSISKLDDFALHHITFDLTKLYSYNNPEIDGQMLKFRSYNVEGFILDLYKILYEQTKSQPWTDVKYKKRLYRLVFFLLVYILELNKKNTSGIIDNIRNILTTGTVLETAMSNIKTDKILNNLLSYNVSLHRYDNPKKDEYVDYITNIFTNFGLTEESKRIITSPDEYFESANDIRYLKKYLKYKNKYLALKSNNN
uniref:Uncharacterized protein n=1 Tax=Megaviridae environmental sample TaxID=1737588 RepID=A0A5J6VLH5_9VIRU|nr:MAG: hypothetical protein [Megaviridae environmental sample]